MFGLIVHIRLGFVFGLNNQESRSPLKVFFTMIAPLSKMKRTLLLLLLCSVENMHFCKAAKVSGDFKLSGSKTEVVLGSFVALPKGAYAQLNVTADGPYPQSAGQTLYFRAYRDTEWPMVQKLTLCSEKVKFALYEQLIEFESATPEKKKAISSGTKEYKAKVSIEVHNKDPITSEELKRNHYWYFTLDDCSLEEYGHDSAVPTISYTIHMRNFRIWKRFYIKYGEISADDQNLFPLHSFSMMTTLIVLILLVLNIIYKLNFDFSKQYTVHAAVLWVTGAALLDFLSGLSELLHIAIYNQDGIGSYTLDAMSAHLEAQCDSMIMILLLSIAAGWTLPSSVITIQGTASSTANMKSNQSVLAMQKLISSLANPISIGMKGPSGSLTIGVVLVHAILAQWGRIYNDNFDSYHDMDHLPGQILLVIRVVVGFLFITAVRQTASSPKCPPALATFYRWYGYVGVTWFWALPIWVVYCHVGLPLYKLKPYVYGGCCVLQGLPHVMLGLLVTTQSTSYHRYSRIATKNQRDTLTDNMDESNNSSTTTPVASTTWTIGRKAKVRLD